MPVPESFDVVLDRQDLNITVARASGAGGQHVNTTESKVRVVHTPSGIAVENQETRSQAENRERCLTKLTALLYQRYLDAQMSTAASERRLQIEMVASSLVSVRDGRQGGGARLEFGVDASVVTHRVNDVITSHIMDLKHIWDGVGMDKPNVTLFFAGSSGTDEVTLKGPDNAIVERFKDHADLKDLVKPGYVRGSLTYNQKYSLWSLHPDLSYKLCVSGVVLAGKFQSPSGICVVFKPQTRPDHEEFVNGAPANSVKVQMTMQGLLEFP